MKSDVLPIRAQQLERRFGKRRALDRVDMTVHTGEIVGLVGPNGSGKTTLLKLIAGLLRPSDGSVSVFGLEPFREQRGVMERARFAFAPPALFDALTPLEHLRHLSQIRTSRMPRVTDQEIHEVLDLVGLDSRATDRIRTLSFGMRQRLALAQALLPRPELLVLDEPTDGLDPLAILELRDVLARMRQQHGLTILLSSHLLVEVEQLVDRMLVLFEGRSLFWGRPHELTDGMQRIHLQVSHTEAALTHLRETGYDAVLGAADRIELAVNGLRLEEARTLLQTQGIELVSFHHHRPSLEDALLKTLREETP